MEWWQYLLAGILYIACWCYAIVILAAGGPSPSEGYRPTDDAGGTPLRKDV